MRYPALEDRWGVATGADDDGPPLVARVNLGLTPLVRHPDFRHQVGVAVPLNAPTPQGLPEPRETEELRALEHALRAELERDLESVLAVILTTEGMREFMFYTRAPEAVPDRVGAVAQRIRTHRLQLMIQEDENWDVYANFRE